MKKVFITTLGCKVNQFESAAFKTGFENHGMKIVFKNSEADLIIINTCGVTASAGAQSRQTIRRALRENPTAEIIITGCYAEIGAKELAKEKELTGRSYSLLGNSKKDLLVKHALTKEPDSQFTLMGEIAKAYDICRLPVRRFSDRSRAFLRVQDGCESFCTYCIVPYTRGPSRSLPVDEVIEQAKIFSREGHKEIVLTGIHLANYGKDLNEASNLLSLLDLLSRATPKVSYRISSLEPQDITESLLSLIQERDNIQPHLHIPLQSGNDEILQAMNRHYTTADFRKTIDLTHKWLPDGAIGIDILAGFPGETDAHFSESKKFLESIYFSYLHVFPYSIRPGTEAANFKNQIPKKTKEERVAQLRSLSDKKKIEFYHQHLGDIRPVLVEGCGDTDGMLKGFTDNYIAVRLEGSNNLLNSIIQVELLEMKNSWVRGKRTAHHEN